MCAVEGGVCLYGGLKFSHQSHVDPQRSLSPLALWDRAARADLWVPG